MTIPILEIPAEIDTICQSYKPLFSEPQFRQFERFITGLMVSDHADIEALSEGYRLSQSYDALHHFVSDRPWEINDVLEQTVRVIKQLPDGQRFHEKGMLIIDDTIIEKFGKLMEAAGKLWDHSKGRYLPYAHCLVGLVWADHQKLRYPLRFELYRKKEQCVDDVPFKTKIELAIALVDWAIEQGIPFSTVVFDSWFFCKEVVDHLESLGKDWISMSKSDRKMVIERKTYSMETYGKTLDPATLPIIKVKNRTYAIQSVQARIQCLKREKQTVRLIVSYEKKADGTFVGPVFLVSNRKDIRPERLLRAYQIRWSIETFFKDAKSHLGLGEYQMRKLGGIKGHWCLVFTSAVILELVRWNVCTEKGINVSELSFGDLKRRAFGNTMRAIIRKVLEYGRDGVPEEQAFALLQV
ncbi:MAG: IS701 family transposase [Deltaproteobacteria bacterium]|nr:IS701 family transposase [Deltaproteobacteria bacterium]